MILERKEQCMLDVHVSVQSIRTVYISEYVWIDQVVVEETLSFDIRFIHKITQSKKHNPEFMKPLTCLSGLSSLKSQENDVTFKVKSF